MKKMPERGAQDAPSDGCRRSWSLVQWCNHPTPSGVKSKDDTPEIWYQVVDKEILKKSKIQQK